MELVLGNDIRRVKCSYEWFCVTEIYLKREKIFEIIQAMVVLCVASFHVKEIFPSFFHNKISISGTKKRTKVVFLVFQKAKQSSRSITCRFSSKIQIANSFVNPTSFIKIIKEKWSCWPLFSLIILLSFSKEEVWK